MPGRLFSFRAVCYNTDNLLGSVMEIHKKIYWRSDTMRNGRMKAALAAVMALMLAVLCVPAGYCSDMVEYEVALTDVRISMPESWHYGDRSITEDNFFCSALGVTPDEFISQFLPDDTVMAALDVPSGTYMTLTVTGTNTGDFSGLSDSEILEIGKKGFAWTESEGHTAVSRDVFRQNGTYYRFAGKDGDLAYYYYVTVQDGKKYSFCFMLDWARTNEEMERTFDSIIGSVAFTGAVNEK